MEDEKHGRECGVEDHRCQDCQDVQRQRSEEKHLKLFQFNFNFFNCFQFFNFIAKTDKLWNSKDLDTDGE